MPGSFTSLLIIQILVAVLVILLAAQKTTSCNYQQRLEPGKTYYIYNPGYPYNYEGEHKCTWDMSIDTRPTILINCTVDLYRSSRSCIDYVAIEGSTSDSSYCTSFYTESSGRAMRLSFRSVAGSEGGRFLCSVISPQAGKCTCGWKLVTRTLGGEETGVNEFPMIASLIDSVKRAHFCGATIISQTWVITAAHCLDTRTPQTTGVVVGEHDLRTGKETNATALFRASRFVIHPDYSRATMKNDIGLVQVAGRIQYSARVGPVCLPFGRFNVPELGEKMIVLGWGPSAGVLIRTNPRVLPIQRCQFAYRNKTVSPTVQFCTFSRGNDSCQMDSGGPLLRPDLETQGVVLEGLVSYGGVCAGDTPSVNTWVYPYIPWIQTATGDEFCIVD